MAGALALLGACGAPPAPAPHVVAYAVAWSRDGVTPATDGPGWEVTSDLGYRVHLLRGWLTSYGMALVECPPTTGGAAGTGAALASLLGPAPAVAGHASGTRSPAAIRPMWVESLVAPVDRAVGRVTLAPHAYCQVRYLIARAGHHSPGLPGEVDMADTSLHVEGTYRADGSEAATPFTIHTPIADGALLDRTASSAPIHVDTGATGARVTVRLQLASMFDGVDFAATSDDARAGRILASLVRHVTVEIASAE